MKFRLPLVTLVSFMMCCFLSVMAGEKLSLKDITQGKFRSKTMTEVRPLAGALWQMEKPMPRLVMTGSAS